MSQLQKTYSFKNRGQKIISFFKDSNSKYTNFLYILAIFIPILLLSFQNCKTIDIDTAVKDSDLPSDLGSIKEPSYDVGQIVEVGIKSGEVIADRLLSLNTDVKIQLFNVDPTSDNYKWTIKRGFESIKTDEATSTGTYQTKFLKSGVHDVFANSYKSTELKTRASKRFIIGESCSASDILEIEILSESASSFKIGDSGSATFALKNSDSFSSIQWRATLPSGQVVTNEEEEDTLTVDLSSEENPGTLVIEVSATSSEATKTECLTYRKKEVIVTSNTRPYLNPLRFTDGRNNVPVTLENNDIYKYERSQTSRYLEIEVLNADSCQYQINNENKVNFSCSSDLIEIPSSTDTSCIEMIITVSASNSQEFHSQSYYHYCPKDDDYCYFSPIGARPVHHVCSSVERASQIQEINLKANPSVTTATTLSCPSGQYNSQSVCNSGKPANSTCSAQGNGCYGWSCTSGYRQSGNSCVPIQSPPSSSTTLQSTQFPVHGGCSSTHYNCNSGSSIKQQAEDSQWRWICQGLNGGKATNCSEKRASPTVHGSCSSTHYNCNSGSSIKQQAEDSQWRWICQGSNGGKATNCSEKRASPAVHGSCSSTHYNCNSGSSIKQQAEDSQWRWICQGSNGGKATNCSEKRASPAVHGGCSPKHYNCNSGSSIKQQAEDSQWRWICQGSNGGKATNCSEKRASPAVHGSCSSTHYNCNSGSSIKQQAEDSQWRWICQGSNGGKATNCSEKRASPAVHGGCSSKHYNCNSGSSIKQQAEDSQWRWICQGSNGGKTMNCSEKRASPAVHGSCSSKHYNCNSGSSIKQQAENSQWRWICQGSNGGKATNCSEKRPKPPVNKL